MSLSYAHTNPGPPSLGSFHLLLQSEAQVVAGRLDLVLGLQVGHGICVDAINGHHKVSLAELGLGCLAAWSDLVKQAEEGVSQGRITWSFRYTPACLLFVMASTGRSPRLFSLPHMATTS